MRPISLIAGAIVLALVAPAVSQEEWSEFASREDGFSVNVPGQPRVEETTWTTQYRLRIPRPARGSTRVFRRPSPVRYVVGHCIDSDTWRV